ncbi:hypothetical protein K1T71_006898 [Dendrolimus kikuchii]|uniref:Uncharacterized protein n=1 Tax=Dendrolimus kikuchii TaxID=765133 RepID=A0ACC1D2P6_9NEOP|nr:hypothetical protein K1T71_006898 [Dendrolimus kikuchii]
MSNYCSYLTISTTIGVGTTMKYLGLVLDSRWEFSAHFKRLAPRLIGAAGALSRLVPNVGGPGAPCRKLYEGVVRSMALYGAPIWAESLTAKNAALLRRPQRALAVRAIRGYRTISFEAASLLAGSPPWDLEARVLAAVYDWRKDALSRDFRPAPREIEAKRAEFRRDLMVEWQNRLAHPSAGHRTVEAVRPVLPKWIDRRHGTLTRIHKVHSLIRMCDRTLKMSIHRVATFSGLTRTLLLQSRRVDTYEKLPN